MNRQEIIIYKTKDGKTTSKPNISQHISNILKEKELYEDSVVKDYLTTAADGKARIQLPSATPVS